MGKCGEWVFYGGEYKVWFTYVKYVLHRDDRQYMMWDGVVLGIGSWVRYEDS